MSVFGRLCLGLVCATLPSWGRASEVSFIKNEDFIVPGGVTNIIPHPGGHDWIYTIENCRSDAGIAHTDSCTYLSPDDAALNIDGGFGEPQMGYLYNSADISHQFIVPTSGDYFLYYSLAGPRENHICPRLVGQLVTIDLDHLEIDAYKPTDDDWTSFKEKVYLAAGSHTIDFSASGQGCMANYVSFVDEVYLTRACPIAIPEPTSLAPLGIGVATLLFRRRL